MNHMRRIIAILLLIAMTLSFSVAFATTIQPYASELIGSRSIVSNVDGGGSVSFTARIIGTGTLEQIGFKSISIQKYDEDTDTWDTIKAVYNKFGYNIGAHAYTVSHSGISGQQYRAKVTYYAKDGDITDTKYKTGTAITA